jgi:hypothetical protein
MQLQSQLDDTNAPNYHESLTIKAFNQMQDIIIVADIIGDLDALAIKLIRNFKSCQVGAKHKTVPSLSQIEFVLVTIPSVPDDKTYNRLALEHNVTLHAH